MLFTVEQAHPGPGTSGAGALQTLFLPRSAFGLRLVWFNKAVVGTWKFLSWDVARAQDRQVPKLQQLGPCWLLLGQRTSCGVCTPPGLSLSQGWVVQRCFSPLPHTKSLLARSSRRNCTVLDLLSSHPQQRAAPASPATRQLPPCWLEASPLSSGSRRMTGRRDEGL